MSGASIGLREWASILVLLIFADIAALLATIDISPEPVVALVVTLLLTGLVMRHRYEMTYFSISPNGNNLATETLTLTHPKTNHHTPQGDYLSPCS
ncbi:hypothetical protein [Rothia aeria]|jgi:hypothetical protein|uniref:hypothetical protein n=1 Tax=Rothia aeria TaxID=172042 RepID=UPI0028E9E6AB|nr:hypothetical protein [Rothia aeria]